MADPASGIAVPVAVAEKTELKQILVCFGERKRAVVFSSGPTVEAEKVSLLSAIKEEYKDVLEPESNIVLQQKSEVWDGEFVDVGDATSITDRSVVKNIVRDLQIIFRMSFGRPGSTFS